MMEAGFEMRKYAHTVTVWSTALWHQSESAVVLKAINSVVELSSVFCIDLKNIEKL